MNQTLIDVSGVMPLAIATGLFVSLCTISAPSGALTTSGAPTGAFDDVAGLVSIPCMDAPPSNARIQATEVKRLGDITAKANRHVLLNDYYASVIDGWRDGWRATVDGTVYDILGSEADSQRQMTRLDLALVTL